MSAGRYKAFLFTLWLSGYFPFHNPLDLTVKKGLRIRQTLTLAWSLVLMIYPLVFFLDMHFSLPVLPSAGSDRLSSTIPWFICLASQFVINASLRLFSIFNSGKWVELVENLHPFKTYAEKTTAAGLRKWTWHRLVWLVYAGQCSGQAFRTVYDLATNGNELKGLKLLSVPEQTVLRFFTFHLVRIVMISCILPPWHFVVTFGSDLIQAHESICAEVAEILVNADPTIAVITQGGKTSGPRLNKAHMRVAQIQERFTNLKKCFKIYEQIAGFYVFCILWWIFVVIVTFFSSLTSYNWNWTDVLKKADAINYGAWSILFIYMVASFGEYMATSIEKGREAISDALGRLGAARILEGKQQVMTVNYLFR